MNPTPCRGSQQLRQVMCQHYSKCLDRAVAEDWPGFTCRACSSYTPAQLDIEEITNEAWRCNRLFDAVFGEKRWRRRRDLTPP